MHTSCTYRDPNPDSNSKDKLLQHNPEKPKTRKCNFHCRLCRKGNLRRKCGIAQRSRDVAVNIMTYKWCPINTSTQTTINCNKTIFIPQCIKCLSCSASPDLLHYPTATVLHDFLQGLMIYLFIGQTIHSETNVDQSSDSWLNFGSGCQTAVN